MPGWVCWLFGVTVFGVAAAVAVSAAVVYGRRLEVLQGRVDELEQRCLDVETSLRTYVDQRLTNFIQRQVEIRNQICIE